MAPTTGGWQQTQRPALQMSNGEPSAGHQRAPATSQMQVPRHALSRSSKYGDVKRDNPAVGSLCRVSCTQDVGVVPWFAGVAVVMSTVFFKQEALPGCKNFHIPNASYPQK